MPTLTTSQGFAIAYEAFGRPADPPLVLIQGLSAQMIGWRRQLCELLAAAGFHVIRFDNRDVGRSQKHPAGGYTLADMAADTAELLDGLGLPRAHVVGQSMGGMIAQLLTIARPELVASLGLVYTAADLTHAIGQDDVAARLETPAPRDRAEYVAAYLAGEAACASRDFPQDTAWLAELGAEMHRRDPSLDGAGRQIQAILTQPSWKDGLAGVAVPTLALAGDSDHLIDPAASFELFRLVPGARLCVVPGMGHELPRACWPEIARLVVDNARRGAAPDQASALAGGSGS
jgi:pimeloyl-ACP methyl ester carboxylesterase